MGCGLGLGGCDVGDGVDRDGGWLMVVRALDWLDGVDSAMGDQWMDGWMAELAWPHQPMLLLLLLLMVAPDGDAEADDGVVSGDFIYLIGADEPEMVGCQLFVRASRTLIRDAPSK